jgi:hypothetical protein
MQLPPFFRDRILGFLGIKLSKAQEMLRGGQQLQRPAVEAADDIEQAAERYLRNNANNAWTYIERNSKGGIKNFPQHAGSTAPNLAKEPSVAARYHEGRLNFVAIYDGSGALGAIIDFFSWSGRTDNIFPEIHFVELGGKLGDESPIFKRIRSGIMRERE